MMEVSKGDRHAAQAVVAEPEPVASHTPRRVSNQRREASGNPQVTARVPLAASVRSTNAK
jgi:hypothetical protein